MLGLLSSLSQNNAVHTARLWEQYTATDCLPIANNEMRHFYIYRPRDAWRYRHILLTSEIRESVELNNIDCIYHLLADIFVTPGTTCKTVNTIMLGLTRTCSIIQHRPSPPSRMQPLLSLSHQLFRNINHGDDLSRFTNQNLPMGRFECFSFQTFALE